ncbi:DUF402 domain-containing protein [Glutamicibacter sp. PS]|uniref:DUF402 domain-containing protein n=1 Tax=Glutamicibacter sp. PS TaxID=3075634 RepID=UPI00284E19D2|nr:DUF402 domain-containing protein [Glutamicibacter sp. PS]MDR4532473.1 YgaC family protein [Glutamicibacter sp. PS]
MTQERESFLAHLQDEPHAQYGDFVVARAWKFDGTPHWVVPGYYLGADEYGHWIHQPAGSLVARPGSAHLAASDALCLIPRGESWVATLYDSAQEDFDVYIDLSTSVGWAPLKSGGWELNSIDMDLDAIRSRTRGVFLDDEDEFTEHAAQMGYPRNLQLSLRQTADGLLQGLADDRPPFNHSYRAQWRQRAANFDARDTHVAKG